MDKKRIVHTLDTPYSAVEWPQISQEDQDAILELLCQLLAPLGAHRRAFTTPSKGKRKRSKAAGGSETPATAAAAAPGPTPPVPELASYVDVGLSKISRSLQDMSSKVTANPAPKEATTSPTPGGGGADPAPTGDRPPPPYTVIFVARAGQSSAFHAHFPQMVALAAAAAAAADNNDEAVRLVGLSAKACEDRLSAALGIPRASSIALRGGGPPPQAKGLVDFVRERVAPVEAEWLREERGGGKFLETRIAAVPTRVGAKKVKSS